MDDTRPAPHTVGMFADHPDWKPAPFHLPDDPEIGVWVTNVHKEEQALAMRTYYALHRDADFSVGVAKPTATIDRDTLKFHGIVGIYANRKRANG